jgi:hypothetical protein
MRHLAAAMLPWALISGGRARVAFVAALVLGGGLLAVR